MELSNNFVGTPDFDASIGLLTIVGTPMIRILDNLISILSISKLLSW